MKAASTVTAEDAPTEIYQQKQEILLQVNGTASVDGGQAPTPRARAIDHPPARNALTRYEGTHSGTAARRFTPLKHSRAAAGGRDPHNISVTLDLTG